MNMRIAILAMLVAAGCHGKNADTTEGESGMHGVPSTGDPTDHSGAMVAPEKMDEVKRDLQRKANIVSHCLATAIEAKEVQRGAHGKIALEIVISGRKASSVKVVRSDIEAKMVQDCVIKHVQSIEFPDVG